MAAPDRRKRKKKVVVKTLVRVFFVLLLLSMLAAYISNQVTISTKRAELDTLNEQIAQQQTENQEMQRILSGDADDVTEWVARGWCRPGRTAASECRVGRAGFLQLRCTQRAHLCGCDRQLNCCPFYGKQGVLSFGN